MMSVLKSAKCSKHYLHQQPPSCQRYVQQQVAFPHSPFADQATCTVQMCLHHHLVQPGGVTAPATPMMIQKTKTKKRKKKYMNMFVICFHNVETAISANPISFTL